MLDYIIYYIVHAALCHSQFAFEQTEHMYAPTPICFTHSSPPPPTSQGPQLPGPRSVEGERIRRSPVPQGYNPEWRLSV